MSSRHALKEVLIVINGTKGDPHSFDALEKVLDDQAYRLSFWRVASDEINYRRFFDINDLAAIRVENPDVFANVHRIPFELIQKSLVSGIRIDHPDGLFDPLRIFRGSSGSGASARRCVRKRLRQRRSPSISTWLRKRFWSEAKNCGPAGPSKAPPATAS